ncbi:MAG: Ig-like domain-containing protein, partial [Thermaceae bacterium]
MGEIKEEGRYALQAVGYKGSAKKVETPSVEISLLRPQVSILEPSVDAVLRGSVTVRVRATDNVEVKEVKLFSGDTSLGQLTSGENGEYRFSVDTRQLADGPHTLRAVAKDRSGNTGESKVAVVVDNKVPVVRWIFPVDGQRVEGVV